MRKSLDSTPDKGAPDESILDQGVIPSNEVIKAQNSQMNSNSENEKNLVDQLKCVEHGTGDTRVSHHNKPKKIFMSVVQEQGIRVTFILCIFYIVICAVAISRFSIQCRLHLR
jgi:hypothetical protein